MKQQLFIRTAIVGGVITGFATFFLTFILDITGFKPLGRHFFLFLPVYAAVMMLTMTWYRNYKNGGILGGSQAIIMGFLINLLGSVFYATSLYLFLRFVNDEMLQNHHVDLIKLMTEYKEIMIKDTGAALYEKNLAAIQQIPSPANIATDTLLKTSLGGFFVAFIIALGLRKSE